MSEETQSTAEELALVLEGTTSIEAGRIDRVAEVTGVEFPVALRGYDRMAVDHWVSRVGEIVRELEATRSPEGAIRQALERVGGEVADILKRAHATAEEVTRRSTAEAESRLSAARRESEELLTSARSESEAALTGARSEAESLVAYAQSEAERLRSAARTEAEAICADGVRRVKALDADADRVWSERQRILDDVRDLAGQLEALVDDAADRFPADDAPTLPPDAPAADEAPTGLLPGPATTAALPPRSSRGSHGEPGQK